MIKGWLWCINCECHLSQDFKFHWNKSYKILEKNW